MPSHMRPSGPPSDAVYLRPADSEKGADLSVRHDLREEKNLDHLSIRQFGLSVSGPEGSGGPSLLGSILRVIGLSTEEQMGRIHAGRIIAAVKDSNAFRDRPVSQGPCEPVGKNHAVFPRMYSAISRFRNPASPRPALAFDHLDLRPKSSLYGLAWPGDRGRPANDLAPTPHRAGKASCSRGPRFLFLTRRGFKKSLAVGAFEVHARICITGTCQIGSAQ